MPAALLLVLYLGLIALPFALAIAQGQPPRPMRDELATGLGIAALVAMQVEFLLSGRFRTISRRIGMDVTMRLHQLLARGLLALVLLHPFLYSGPQGVQSAFGGGVALAGRDWLNYGWSALWPGIVAWLGLAALATMALGHDALGYRYQRWRLAHGLGALAISGMATLHALRAGRYSADPALTLFWQISLGVAVLSLIWVYALKPLWKRAHPWRVTAVTPLSPRTWDLRLAPVGHAGLRYRAGHFAWLSVGRSPASLDENPFSIASAPSEGPDLRFVIKEFGDFTSTVGTIVPGTPAYVDGPYGSLTLQRHTTAPGVVLIAGGVGIAPMLSILRELAATHDPRPRTLIYANRNQTQIAAKAELDALSADTPLRVIHVLHEPHPGWQGETGVVTEDLLGRCLPDPAQRGWVHVLCGPPPMLDAAETALLHMGVAPRNILMEQFSYDHA